MEAKSHVMCVAVSTTCCSDAPLFFKVIYALLSSIIRSCCLLLDILPIKKEMTLMAPPRLYDSSDVTLPAGPLLINWYILASYNTEPCAQILRTQRIASI